VVELHRFNRLSRCRRNIFNLLLNDESATITGSIRSSIQDYMNCPHCQAELQNGAEAQTCPACGVILGASAAPRTPRKGLAPWLNLLRGAAIAMLWSIVIITGMASLVLAILFAGCVCTSLVHR
jgi:predicted RNA-binding Zn-ribbon protein involved in translation (DUF1610 family)